MRLRQGNARWCVKDFCLTMHRNAQFSQEESRASAMRIEDAFFERVCLKDIKALLETTAKTEASSFNDDRWYKTALIESVTMYRGVHRRLMLVQQMQAWEQPAGWFKVPPTPPLHMCHSDSPHSLSLKQAH